MDGYPDPEQVEAPCPICHGRGWVSRRARVGDPDFGEVFPCRCQEIEAHHRRLSYLHRYSNLGPLSGVSFDETRFEGRLSDPQGRTFFGAAFEASKAFAEEPAGWLVLTGASGSGKTHLAAAIANRCIERGHATFFVSVPNLMDHLRGTFAPDSAVSYDELFQQVKDAPLLVLDDLGSHIGTSWAQEKLMQVFNHRFNARLPTIITVRGPLQRLEEGLRTRMEAENFSNVYHLGHRAVQLLRIVGSLTEEMREQMTFDAFSVDQRGRISGQERDSLTFAVETARTFAEAPKGWLLLTGLRGCGKTHLAVAIINERLPRKDPVFFAFVPDLLDHLRATFTPDSVTGYDELFELVKTAPLLVLDDLGSERSTPWAEEKLYQLIVHRHNARLSTVITSNLASLKQLEEAKPRVASRLGDALVQWAPMMAPDYRDQRPSARDGQRPR